MVSYIRLGLFQKAYKTQKIISCEANLGRNRSVMHFWQHFISLSTELRSLVYDLLKCGLAGDIGIDEISSFLGELVSVLVRYKSSKERCVTSIYSSGYSRELPIATC